MNSFLICVAKCLLISCLLITFASCNDSAQGTNQRIISPPDPIPIPTPVPITFVLNAVGGHGSSIFGTGVGGNGGQLKISKFGGTGDIHLAQLGRADASFVTANIVEDLFINPLEVTSDTTIFAFDAHPVSGVQTIYTLNSAAGIQPDGLVHFIDGNIRSAKEFTGIRVNEAVTLTLQLNGVPAVGGIPYSQLIFSNDFILNGTLTLEIESVLESGLAQWGGIVIEANYISIGPNAKIVLNGVIPGQQGGFVRFVAKNIQIAGDITTNGLADVAGNGGSGGSIDMEVSATSEHGITMEGSLLAQGGQSQSIAASIGGSGGSVTLNAFNGPIWLSGVISTSGATGDSGGSGGQIQIHADQSEVRNQASITSTGGSAELLAGGAGGNIELWAQGGSMINDADLDCSGGDSQFGTAGAGCIIKIVTNPTIPADLTLPAPQAAGSLVISGNIDYSGGTITDATSDAGIGGNAGELHLIADVSGTDHFSLPTPTDINGATTADQKIEMLGYSGFSLFGGNGSSQGGNASQIDISNQGEQWVSTPIIALEPFEDAQGGNIIIAVPIEAYGGDVNDTVLNARGGSGAGLSIRADIDVLDTEINGNEQITISADMHLQDGNSYGLNFVAPLPTPRVAAIDIQASGDLVLSAAIIAHGSHDLIDDDDTTTGLGISGPLIHKLYSQTGTVNITHTLDISGGNGEFTGGNASGSLEIRGVRFVIPVQASILNAGGSADALLEGSVGGVGGNIVFGSPEPVNALYPFELCDITSIDSFVVLAGTSATLGIQPGKINTDICKPI